VKELRLQALGLSLDRNKSQVVNNHAISRVNEPPNPNPQGGSVELQIRYLNYQNALGASTAQDRDAKLYCCIPRYVHRTDTPVQTNQTDVPSHWEVKIYLNVHADSLSCIEETAQA
jgi:hypothetical protein